MDWKEWITIGMAAAALVGLDRIRAELVEIRIVLERLLPRPPRDD